MAFMIHPASGLSTHITPSLCLGLLRPTHLFIQKLSGRLRHHSIKPYSYLLNFQPDSLAYPLFDDSPVTIFDRLVLPMFFTTRERFSQLC
jgi:hypothetical protein